MTAMESFLLGIMVSWTPRLIVGLAGLVSNGSGRRVLGTALAISAGREEPANQAMCMRRVDLVTQVTAGTI